MKTADLILYADDDADDRDMLHQVFSECSTQPFLSFASADELISFLYAHPKDVCAVILDINMPLKSGLEALAEIRSNKDFDEMPIVIYTTASNPLAIEAIIRMRALTLTKARSYSEMKEAVEKIFGFCKAFSER